MSESITLRVKRIFLPYGRLIDFNLFLANTNSRGKCRWRIQYRGEYNAEKQINISNFNVLSSHMVALKSEMRNGGKLSKVRITFMIGANTTGTGNYHCKKNIQILKLCEEPGS